LVIFLISCSVDFFGDVFHELGHALHSLLSSSPFQHLSGTRVPCEFTEMPSQLMEKFLGVYPLVCKFLVSKRRKGGGREEDGEEEMVKINSIPQDLFDDWRTFSTKKKIISHHVFIY